MVHVFRLLVAYDRSQVRPKITPHVFFLQFTTFVSYHPQTRGRYTYARAFAICNFVCVVTG